MINMLSKYSSPFHLLVTLTRIPNVGNRTIGNIDVTAATIIIIIVLFSSYLLCKLISPYELISININGENMQLTINEK